VCWSVRTIDQVKCTCVRGVLCVGMYFRSETSGNVCIEAVRRIVGCTVAYHRPAHRVRKTTIILRIPQTTKTGETMSCGVGRRHTRASRMGKMQIHSSRCVIAGGHFGGNPFRVQLQSLAAGHPKWVLHNLFDRHSARWRHTEQFIQEVHCFRVHWFINRPIAGDYSLSYTGG